MALGLLLIAGAFPSVVRPAAVLVLSAFIGILALELLSPTPRPCGCLGTMVLPGLSPRLQLALSAGIDLLLIALLATSPSNRLAAPLTTPHPA